MVRAATPEDIDVLVHQRHMMFEHMRPVTPKEHRAGDRAYRLWALRQMKKGRFRGIFISDGNGRVAAGGCVWLRERQPSPSSAARLEPYLLSMYTEPEFRRKGLASVVVKEAMKWAKAKGYPRMRLHASELGRGVYEKLGWERSWEMRVDL